MKQFVKLAGMLISGVCIGIFTKYLDYRQAELPYLLQKAENLLDMHNFLGGFAPWIVIGVCIAIYSRTPGKAAVHSFAFFAGMISGYYLYCYYVAGFYPKSYAAIWIGVAIASPVLAYVCWYAKKEGFVGMVLSGGILSTLISTAFSFGFFYITLFSWKNVVMIIIGILVLRRNGKETVGMLGIGLILAVLAELYLPIHIW